MKFLRILPFLFLWCPGTLAQQSLSDSLQNRLNTSISDTTRVLVLDKLGRSLMYSQPIVAMQYAQEGLTIAKKIGYQRGAALIQNRIGTVFRLTGNYGRSLEAHLASVAIAKAAGDIDALARTYNNLGNLYSEQKQPQQAIDYYRKTAVLATQLNDAGLKRIALSNIGSEFALQNRLDSALTYTRTAYQLALDQQANDSQIERMILANIYKRMKRGELALRYYRASIPASLRVKNDRTLSQAYLEMAEVFQADNRLDSATIYAKKSLQLAQSSQMLTYVVRASNLLSELYEPTAPRLSVTYLKLAAVAKDSLEQVEKVRNFQNVEFGEKVRQQDLKQAQETYRSQIILYALLGITMMAVVITLLLYRTNRQQQKAHRRLFAQQTETNQQREKAEATLAELRTTQAQLIQREKLASLGELTAGIAHEIQNPLNFVNNFSEVSADLVHEIEEEREKGTERDTELEAELLGDLKQNLQKIAHHGGRASAIVRGMLEHSRSGTGEKRSVDLNALTSEYLNIAYQGLRAKDKDGSVIRFNAQLITNLDPAVSQVNLMPQEIGRVLLNLLNNAFYAVRERQKTAPPDYQPTLTVSTRLVSPERATSTAHPNGARLVEIRIKDNGTGIPDAVRDKIFQPFFTTKPTGEGTGLGLSLSYDIIKGHGGTLSVESSGAGTEFIVTLPKP